METPSKKEYYLTTIALFILLGLTLLVAELHLGMFSVIVALTIAAVKAVLIVLWFMHVRYQSSLIWAFSIAGFLWLMILFGLMFGDYLTRDWIPVML